MRLVGLKGFLLWMAVVMAFAVTACSDDEYHSRLKELVIRDVQFGAHADSIFQTFRDEDLSHYLSKSDQDWCVATIKNHGLTIKVAANETYSPREAVVTINDKADASVTRSLKVTQAQDDAVLIAEDIYEIGAEGGKLNINVQANVEYKVKIADPDWIKLVPTAKTRALNASVIALTIEKNNSGGERSGKVIVTNSSTGKTIEISIKQKFTPEFSVSTDALTIDERGGDLKLLVNRNFQVETAFADEWVTDAGKDVLDEFAYWQKIHVAPFNEKTASRSSKITFSNLALKQYKEVTITQKRPIYIQAVNVPLSEGDTYELPLYNEQQAAVVWKSSDEKVVTVSATGVLTAKAVGKATVSVASADNQHTDEVTVTVSKKEVPFQPEFSVMTETLSTDERGGELRILVKANFKVSVSFTDQWLTDEGQETVDSLVFWQKVKAAEFKDKTASRKSTIALFNLEHGQYKEVTIEQHHPLYIQATNIPLTVGDTYVLPLYNELQSAVEWRSSDEAVVKVALDGKVTALTSGTATVTVTSTDGVHSDEVTITVNMP